MIALAFALMLAVSILNSLGQLLFKLASHLDETRRWRPLCIPLGIGCYLLGIQLIISAFRFGDVTVLWPLASLSFVWNVALARRFVGERMTGRRWLGTALIVAGSVVVGLTVERPKSGAPAAQNQPAAHSEMSP